MTEVMNWVYLQRVWMRIYTGVKPPRQWRFNGRMYTLDALKVLELLAKKVGDEPS